MNDMIREFSKKEKENSDLAFRGCDAEIGDVIGVTAGEKISTHDPEPVGTECDIQIPEYDWVPNDWETESEAQILGADSYQENIVETTHVSLGTNDATDCSLSLKAEELVVVII